MKIKLIPILAVILSVFFLGCSKLEGEFAFRKQLNDKYKRMNGRPEFSRDETIKWVFILKNLTSPIQVGVTVLKKEVVWVDVVHWTENLNISNKIIYGTIEDLEAGMYRIVITGKESKIGEKEFVIYEREDKNDLPY